MQTIQLTRKENYAILQLNRGKVNALNHLMVNEIREAVRDLEADPSVGGVILTGIPHFFSAGLDVIELYQYDAAKMKEFLIDFGSMHIELVRFTKPLICAINGHSPAGGTVIAIAADYRIMAEGEKYTIGLNEVAVNIQISQNLVEAYSFWIGKGKAHRFVMDGKLLNGEEALACGLVDEVVAADQLLPLAEKKMQQYLQAHPEIMKNTKAKLRASWLERLEQFGERDLEQTIQLWWDPEIRARMKAFVDRLTKK